VDHEAEEYLRMALDIEPEDYVKFTEECKSLDLKYRWVLDAIIITCIKERTEEQLSLIAHFCESYEISKKELQYIAAVAKAFLSMSETEYVNAYEIKEESVPDTVFGDYMYLITKSSILSNEHITIFQPSCREDVTVQALERIQELNTPVVKITGAELSLQDYELVFRDKEKVILEGCSFTGKGKVILDDSRIFFEDSTSKGYPICFYGCNQIVIKNCRFTDFQSKTLVIDDAESVMVDGCEFTNCKIIYYGDYLKELKNDCFNKYGIIISHKPNRVKRMNIIDSSFTECGNIIIKALNYSICEIGLISNIKSSADNCHFKNENDNNMLTRYDDIYGLTLFPEGSSATNCTFENSAKFS
jgi:hypothetical protein